MSGSSSKKLPDKKPDVPERIKTDLQKFKSIIANSKDSRLGRKTAIDDLLEKKLKDATNPFLYILDLIYYSSDILKINCSSFNQDALNTFHKLLQNNEISGSVDLEIKKLAVNMFMQMKTQPGIQVACLIFDLYKDRALFKDIIENHIMSGHFQQVCPIIIALDLQPFFTLDQVVLPLIFRDQRVIVEQYLQGYPEMQLELVKILDRETCNRAALTNFMIGMNVEQKMISKFDIHYMQKLIGKLLNTFKIPIEECPNLLLKRSYGALNYMIKKRFNDHEMTNDSFEEMALNAVKDNISLQQELLTRLVCINEMALALKIAKKLPLKPKSWPGCLRSYVENNPSSSATPSDNYGPKERWDESFYEPSEVYLRLRIDKSSIHLIDTVDKFIEAVETIEAYDVVGFDAEWRPSFGVKNSSKLALLQLAVWDYIYLLDILALTQCLDSTHWSRFFERIFSNPNILKLGFATTVDLEMLKTYCSGEKNDLSFNKVLDLEIFVRKILITYPNIKSHLPPIDEEFLNFKSDRGLSKVCRAFLGLPLCKIEQFSDWERRPLREAQIIYAALDAFCLLQIYEQLFKSLRLIDLNVDDIIADYFKPNKKDLKPQKGLSKVVKHTQLQTMYENKKYNYSRASLPISKFKVVVDNMLNGLGKELRICGADVILLENSLHHSDAVKIALSQKRCFITTGKVFNQLAGYMPPGMCFSINVGPVEKQISDICDYFNVYCTEDDVFTRCTLCNCNRYLKITAKDMETLWASSKNLSKPLLDGNCTNLKPFIHCDGGFVTSEGIMNTGNKVLLDGLSQIILQANSTFNVCSACGKVYWEGSHHRNKKQSVHRYLNSCSKENGSPEKSCSSQGVSNENLPNSASNTNEKIPVRYYAEGQLSSDDDDDEGICFDF